MDALLRAGHFAQPGTAPASRRAVRRDGKRDTNQEGSASMESFAGKRAVVTGGWAERLHVRSSWLVFILLSSPRLHVARADNGQQPGGSASMGRSRLSPILRLVMTASPPANDSMDALPSWLVFILPVSSERLSPRCVAPASPRARNSSLASSMSSSAAHADPPVEPVDQQVTEPADQDRRTHAADPGRGRSADPLGRVPFDRDDDRLSGLHPSTVEGLVAEALRVEHPAAAAVVVHEFDHGPHHGSGLHRRIVQPEVSRADSTIAPISSTTSSYTARIKESRSAKLS